MLGSRLGAVAVLCDLIWSLAKFSSSLTSLYEEEDRSRKLRRSYEATYWTSVTKATKSSLSESTINSGLIAFLRGLRRGVIEGKLEGRNRLVKT